MRLLLAALAAVAVSMTIVAPATGASGGGAVAGPPAPTPGIEVGPPLPTPPPASPGSEEIDIGEEDDPGFFDIPGKVKKAINDWFRSLVENALEPALKLVGETVLSTPQITGHDRVQLFWQYSLGIANALLVLVIVVAGAIVMHHETVQTSYALKDALPRIGLAAVAANASLAISAQMVSFANALSSGFLTGGIDPAKASESLTDYILNPVTSGGIFIVLLGLVCNVFAVVLLVLYVARAAVIVLLVCAAPLMLLAHALPQTEQIAYLWWRAMTAALAVQVVQALILAAAVEVFLTPSGRWVLGLPGTGTLIDLLVGLCLLWLLVKVPLWAKSWAVSSRPSRVTQIVKNVVIARVIRAVGALV
jgi:hypothetical protein